jgi:hypothetical protein
MRNESNLASPTFAEIPTIQVSMGTSLLANTKTFQMIENLSMIIEYQQKIRWLVGYLIAVITSDLDSINGYDVVSKLKSIKYPLKSDRFLISNKQRRM